jgi:hypothetical protein
MKYRYLFFVAGGAFLIVAILALVLSRDGLAAGVNAVTGAIFIFLGFSPPKRPPRP